jgi:hypothetical protein
MKPRKIESPPLSARGECVVHDGEKIVDASINVFDGKHSADEIIKYAKWLLRAAKWLKSSN